MTTFDIGQDVDSNGFVIKQICQLCQKSFSSRGLRTHHASIHSTFLIETGAKD